MSNPPLNVLFVVLDTVRAKSLSSYESSHRIDNCLQEVADRGEMYTNAIAPSAWTLPSHVSMFTGQLPSEHGVISPSDQLESDESLPLLLEEAGFDTFGISANPFIGSRNGFSEVFAEFQHVVPTPTTRAFEKGGDALTIVRSVNETKTTKIHAIASQIAQSEAPLRTGANLLWYKLSQIRARRRRERQDLTWGPEITESLSQFFHSASPPFFAFANYMEAHRPYCAPQKYIHRFFPDDVGIDPEEVELDPWAHILGVEKHTDEEIRAARGLYRAAIAYLDDQLRQLLDALEEAGIRNETLVVVTSDHGEAFGERGRLDHNCLYQPVTRVPLILDHPSREPAEVSTPVSLCQLFPTVLEVAGINGFEGRTLFEKPPDAVCSQYLDLHVKDLRKRFDKEKLDPFTKRLQSAFNREFQFLLDDQGADELIPLDGSVQPITGRESVRDELAQYLPEFEEVIHSTPESEGPDEELLRSLGYIE